MNDEWGLLLASGLCAPIVAAAWVGLGMGPALGRLLMKLAKGNQK